MGRRLNILAGVLFCVLSGVWLEAKVVVVDTIWFRPRAGNGIGPQGVSVNPNTNKLYVVGTRGSGIKDSIFVIDGMSDSVEQTAFVPGNPLYIAVNDSTSRFYATCPDEGIVAVLLDGARMEESAKNQRSSIYFLRFTSGDCRETRKLIVVK